LQNTKQNFKAGKVKTELKHWMNITKDEWILNTIQGYRLEVNRSPCQTTTPRPYKFNQSEITQMVYGGFVTLQFRHTEFTVENG